MDQLGSVSGNQTAMTVAVTRDALQLSTAQHADPSVPELVDEAPTLKRGVDQDHQPNQVESRRHRDRLDANQDEDEGHPGDVAAEGEFRQAQTNRRIEATHSAGWTRRLVRQRHQ